MSSNAVLGAARSGAQTTFPDRAVARRRLAPRTQIEAAPGLRLGSHDSMFDRQAASRLCAPDLNRMVGPCCPTGAQAARSVFGCSCRRRAGPRGERVPFGLSHAAFFIADFDKNKRSVVLSGLRSSECGRKSVRVSDSCCVCQVNLLTRLCVRDRCCCRSIKNGFPMQYDRHSDQQSDENGQQYRRHQPLTKFEFYAIGHPTACLVEAGAQCSQSPITATDGR